MRIRQIYRKSPSLELRTSEDIRNRLKEQYELVMDENGLKEVSDD